MKEAEIRKYAKLMKELDLTGLEITEDNKVIRLERNCNKVQKIIIPKKVYDVSEIDEDINYISVKSPLVGVFYSAPAENTETFVKIGDRVEKGKTLCIIESMKLMNEILAEEDGIIEKVCVTNGQIVEYGTELFRIRRTNE